jgi:hypothetical protein
MQKRVTSETEIDHPRKTNQMNNANERLQEQERMVRSYVPRNDHN